MMITDRNSSFASHKLWIESIDRAIRIRPISNTWLPTIATLLILVSNPKKGGGELDFAVGQEEREETKTKKMACEDPKILGSFLE